MGWQNSPSCNCCGLVCVLFADDFDRSDSSSLGGNWTELVGDWEIVGNEMSIDSSGAAIRCDEIEQSTVAVVVDVTPASNGDKARVCVLMVDEDEYVCAEVEFGTSSSTVRLFDRSAGSDGSALDTAASSDVTVGGTYQVTVCIEGGSVSAVVANSSGKRLMETEAGGAGGSGLKTGLATGNSVATAITFNDFMVLTRDDECQICGICNPLPFVDDFSSLDANWIPSIGAGDISVSAGNLILGSTSTNTTAQIRRCVKAPTGSNWTFTGQITLVDVVNVALVANEDWSVVLNLQSGLQGLATITARHDIAASARWDIALTGAGSSTNTPHTSSQQPADGSVLKFVMTENGDGTYDVSFYDDATLLATHTGGTVPATLEWTVSIGIVSGGVVAHATIDDFSLVQT